MTAAWVKSLWRDDRRLRRRLLVIDVGLFAFWPYLVAFIFAHPAAKGSDGFEVIAVVPATLIALCLSVPALLLSISNRTLRFGVWVTLAAAVTNACFFIDLRWNCGLVREWQCSTIWTLGW